MIWALADTGSVLELRGGFGAGMMTALVRVAGRPMGLIANNPRHLGGAIDANAADKAARFLGLCDLGLCDLGLCDLGLCDLGLCDLGLCDAHGLPVLSLCDTPGFTVGPDAACAPPRRLPPAAGAGMARPFVDTW